MTVPGGDQFAIVPRYVVYESSDSIGVYASIRLFADYETGECWPSIDTVAEILGVSRRTVERHLAKLEAIGAIRKESGKASGETNLYRFPASRYDIGVAGGTTPVSHRGTTSESHKQEPVERDPSNEKKTGRLRRRDLLWEAFVEIHGDPASKSERGKFNRIVSILRDADVTPEEYPSLVAAFSTKWEGKQVAPATVSERIGELRHFLSRGPVSVRSIEEVESDRRWALLEEEEPNADRQIRRIEG